MLDDHDALTDRLLPVAPADTALDPADAEAVRQDLARSPGDGTALLARMRQRLDGGRAALRDAFEQRGLAAEDLVRALSRQMDGLVQGGLDFAASRLFRTANPTKGEALAVLAVGGYGRGELAPHSDVDLLFLFPYKRTPYVEQMAEFLLYKLWDAGLKVGHASRSIAECIKLAQDDISVSTALLESRALWGAPELEREFRRAYDRDIVAGHGNAFVEAKLAERDQRHQRMGDSRFLLEPNIKEGKGGLRDLQTLIWLGRFLHGTDDLETLARKGFLPQTSLPRFRRARSFLWTVRCHLHYLTDRPEERLTVDLQPQVARRMGYRDRSRTLGVERFMKHYYLIARDVGSLTRIVCSALEERQRPRLRFAVPGLATVTRRRIDGFLVERGRIGLAEPDLFVRRPVAMLAMFHLALERDLDVHPAALAALSLALRRVDATLREDPTANRTFMEILASRKDGSVALGRMNEAGLLGRFIPDFGRIVAQMQHGMYHVYTTDEHTIRAIAVLHQIEQGRLVDELPLATELMPKVLSRAELYLAVFLHDIGKGRGGDHATIGARIAERLGPRLGLSAESTETVAWLVQHHLLMSETAFKRDLEDPKTISDFVEIVQSPERLRLLLVLTVADIRAVGPNVWNGWKGQLLRELYHEAETAMAAGDAKGRRAERVQAAREALAAELAKLGWSAAAIAAHVERHDPRYWLGFPTADHVRHAQVIQSAHAAAELLAIDFRVDRFRARTELLLYAADHAGLFMKIAGALALSGVSIVDAHIFTTSDGMALDALGFQDAENSAAVDEPARLERIRQNIRKALCGELWLEKALANRRQQRHRTDVFKVEPRVLIDNNASRTHSVIEVNGRDRPGLLFEVAKALKELGLVISSAHITTYGERVVDVFYVKDVFGMKITQRSKLSRAQKALVEALQAG